MVSAVALRNLIEDDLPTLFAQQLDTEAVQMAAFPARSQDAFMKHWTTKVLANESAEKKAIVVDNRVAGYVLSWEQDEKHLIGYWIGKEYWGKGIATEALRAFLFLLKMRPLHAFVAKHNIGSVRVLEKCGFTVSKNSTFFSEVHGHDMEEILMVLA